MEVHLFGGEVFKAANAEAVSEHLVSFSAYPDATPGSAVLEAMVKDRRDPDDGDYFTARVVVVATQSVLRVDLLHNDAPAARTVGFHAPAT